MSTRLDRMIERARGPLSALRPVVPSTFSVEPPVREDVQENWSGGAEPDRRSRASFPSPLVVPFRGDVQVNSEVSTPSRLEQDNAANSAERIRVSDQRASDQRGDAQRGHEASPLPRMEPPRVRPALLAEKGVRSSRDEANLPMEKSLAPQAAERTGSVASKRSALDDLPAAGVALPSPKDISRENRLAHLSNEIAAFPAHGKKADATPLTASSLEFQESPIEINVSIGSIDFRSARPAPARKRSEAHPRVTLENYLQRGKRDGR